ncbi:hypothetical protein PROFUN_01824 [Planoprotostelium fungivorum]|uniref:Uncharacterized protein n=1 Tax=Planoprotostelium fungivorum TaxID=1890364 RepID=A0A2P6NYS2_9EUKA|nr:hypothetical protein PROFUN_01824 [Planoprotostelium fungivorum]
MIRSNLGNKITVLENIRWSETSGLVVAQKRINLSGRFTKRGSSTTLFSLDRLVPPTRVEWAVTSRYLVLLPSMKRF